MDMLEFLQAVAHGEIEASPTQVRAAIAAVQYTHAKVGEGGKKQKRQAEAEKVAARFAPAEPPRLAAVGGKRV
jgi:phage terminase small subunit